MGKSCSKNKPGTVISWKSDSSVRIFPNSSCNLIYSMLYIQDMYLYLSVSAWNYLFFVSISKYNQTVPFIIVNIDLNYEATNGRYSLTEGLLFWLVFTLPETTTKAVRRREPQFP